MDRTSTFGKRLGELMAAHKLRASDVARICDVRRQTVGKWLQMSEANLSAKHAACIALSTGADLMQLIVGDGKPSKRKYSRRMALLSVMNRVKRPASHSRP